MARLHTSGGEIRDHNTVAAEASPDGRSAGTAACTTETSIVRSGSASIACPGTSTLTAFREFAITAPTAGTSLFARAYLRFSALPSATKRILDFGTAHVSARLTSAGKLQLWSAAGTPAQVGSDSTLTLTVDTWYRIELKQTIGTGATDAAELRVLTDGADELGLETVASAATQTWTDTQPTLVRMGWIEAPGVTSSVYLDDLGVNDSTGTQQNSWLGEGRVLVLMPGLRLTMAAAWDSCVDATAEVDSFLSPPQGHTDATGHTTRHQIRHTGGAIGNANYALLSYGRAGISGPYSCSDGVESRWILNDSTDAGAQSFFIGGGGLDYVELRVAKVGTPSDDLSIQILGNTPGSVENLDLPSSTVVASATLAGADVAAEPADPAQIQWYRVPLLAALTPGQKYWLSAKRSGTSDASNYFKWYGDNTGVDTSRENFSATSLDGGATWASPSSRDAGLRLFPTSGVVRLSLVRPITCHGEAIATGSKTGTIRLQTNPTQTTVAFTYGDDVGAAGAYPTNWRWAKGNASYDVAVTNMALNPEIELARTDTTARVADCCFLGAIVEYRQPAPG